MIARASFVKSLPRRESTIAFLCLIDAHLEWPDMGRDCRTAAHDADRASAASASRICHGRAVSAAAGTLAAGNYPSARAVPDEIFKAYDIRGLYGEQIDGDVAEAIGRAFAHVLSDLGGKPAGELRIGLGRDMRLSAPELAGRYRDGMVSEGATVVDAGQVGSEMLYWLVGARELDGGLMCTASHNPKAYTGAKLVREGAIALSGDAGIQDIRRRIAAGLDEHDPPARPWIRRARRDLRGLPGRRADVHRPRAVKPLRVVVDGGNGMAGPMVGPLLEQLGLDLVTAYWTPDGEFPDHEPNPLLPENREFIMRKVVEEKADLGIAWDGDADRCFFIDDRGRFVDGDFLTALLAESLLRKSPGEAILYDVRASRAVADTVAQAGGSAHPNRVGHAFFKTRMRDEGAMFGGEVSGHYYFRDFYCADSGTIPALLILELLSVEETTLSALLDRYHATYFISGEINSTVEDGPAKLAEIEARYADAQIGHLDGVSVDYDDWHFNVRTSNTEPLMRLCLESLVSAAGHGAPPRRGARDHPGMTMSDAQAASERAAAAGIHCLAIPTPFQVGRVNTYLIEDDPLTLVDSGPNSGTALDALERALAGHGHRVEDLELLVISHQHIDHLGLASILARRSGAEVAALDLLAPRIEHWKEGMDADDAFAERVMAEHGIPQDVRYALLAVSQSYRAWGGSAKVTRPLARGLGAGAARPHAARAAPSRPLAVGHDLP